MALTVGSRLGHYEVTALIGEGGMGQVYRATDTTLDRDVALKVLPDAFTADPDRLARFEREAKVLASLNHPNIGAIYGLEKSGDTRALVLELIEGPTLADRIKRGPIPLDEALPIAKQIAEALEAAHEAGVIHRDLKPANIKVRNDGTVKVLDFGLAKALDPHPEGDPSQSPTLTAAATQMGVIMGTAAYMPPEQARGKPVDKRADIWAFGCVLYEMLTGQMAFQGEDVSLTLSAVLQREPEWTVLPPSVAPELNAYLRRCLQKDPRQRVQAIGDVRLAMEGAFETTVTSLSESTVSHALQVWQRPLPLAAGAVVLVAIAGFVGSLIRPETAAVAVTRFAVQVAGGHEMLGGECPRLALSPDGRTLVYVAQGQLYLRHLDRVESVPMVGTEGAENPFFSPDGQSIGFGQGDTLKRMSVSGGLVTDVAGTRLDSGYPCAQAAWSPDGTIVYRPPGARVLWAVPAVGGVPKRVTMLRDRAVETFHTWPQVLDGGRQILFTVIGPS